MNSIQKENLTIDLVRHISELDWCYECENYGLDKCKECFTIPSNYKKKD